MIKMNVNFNKAIKNLIKEEMKRIIEKRLGIELRKERMYYKKSIERNKYLREIIKKYEEKYGEIIE
jgi:di/tripeptidase